MVYRDSDTQSAEDFLWPSASYPTPWYDTTNTTYLISSLDESLTDRSNNIGYISQLVLTPSVDYIIEHVLSMVKWCTKINYRIVNYFLVVGTLKQKCAVEFNDERIEWISRQVPGNNGVNVIIVDFIDLDDDIFSKTVINLNLNLNTSTLGQTGIIQEVKNFFKEIKVYFFK